MKIELRKMTVTDWSQVYAIYRQGMETNLATFDIETLSYEEFDDERLPIGQLVALDGERVIGWTSLKKAYEKIPEYYGVAEVSIYIDQDYQGKGVATRLLENLIILSEEKGFWMLVADIFANNSGSILLHEKCGFRQVGYREKIGKDRFGVWRDTVLMERRSQKVGID
jgi:phosphinothricin acetyltransferase